MRDLCALASATVLLALALIGEAAAQEEWQTVTSADGSFTVEMPPGKVWYFREEGKTGKGTPYVLHQYLLDQGEGQVTFIAQGGAYPNDVDVSNPKSILEANIKKSAEGPQGVDGGKWSSVKWGAQQGAVTVEAVGAKGETDKRSFSALKGRNFFDLDYWGPRGTATSADANRFFASLKIAGGTQGALPSDGTTPLQRDRLDLRLLVADIRAKFKAAP